jgi:hypothetical protein
MSMRPEHWVDRLLRLKAIGLHDLMAAPQPNLRKCIVNVGMPGVQTSNERFISRYCLQSFEVGADILDQWNDNCHGMTDLFSNCGRANMGEIIRFVPKAERERIHLIQEARAIYDGIFPPADPVSEVQSRATVSQTVSGAKARRGDEVLLS